jgi:hypothetical protein
MSWSLKGFLKALETVDVKALEFHNRRGDFESWAEYSLQDEILQGQLKKIRGTKVKGEILRKRLITAVEERFSDASEQVQTTTRLF